MEPVVEQAETVVVRGLKPVDLEPVIGLDARLTGRRREEFFKMKLRQNLADTGIKISLAAELDGAFVGFLLARIFYGEFGAPEPVALLDTIAVHPDFQRLGVGSAMMAQLQTNLGGLGVAQVQTEAGWEAPDLLAFFRRQGFRVAQRLCLDLDLPEAS